MEMESVHSDILVEILTKLPCKDLTICKCVCKGWYDLLSHPNLSKFYNTYSPFTSFFLTQNNSLLLLESHANGDHLTTPMKLTESDVDLEPTIIGSSNGLLFFSQRNALIEKLYCCNPLLTGSVELAEYEVLPRYPASSDHRELYFAAYIPSSSSYKLLRVVSKGFTRVKEAHVLDVGIDGGWRRLDDEMSSRLEATGLCMNGDYIWISDHEDVHFLTAFNLGEERRGWMLKLPEMLQKKYTICLAVLKNCITVVDLSDYFKIGIWRMEEYGVGESWSRKMVIRNQSVSIPLDLHPLAALPDGDNFIMSLSQGRHGLHLDCNKKLKLAQFTPRFCSIV